MVCLNSSYCQSTSRCLFGLCACSNEQYYPNRLSLPLIESILDDVPPLRNIYLFIFILMSSIGLLNNIFSLMTFTRDRIIYTVGGIYLIIYSICSLLLMILILTTLTIGIYSNEYLFHLWSCQGYPYLSFVMIYTSILITAAISIEGVMNTYFNIDKFRSRKKALIISFLLFAINLISNLDKIFARHLITDQSGELCCTYKTNSYEFWSQINTIFFNIYTIIPCFIHLTSIICLLSLKIKGNIFQRIFIYRIYITPALVISFCILFNAFYRYLVQFCLIDSLKYIIRLCFVLIYFPQMFTYLIYIIPNEFYVREFYQVWFYRKLCCCFYDKRRHVQEFEVIHKLWQRRTSLETAKTASTLNDPSVVESEFYK